MQTIILPFANSSILADTNKILFPYLSSVGDSVTIASSEELVDACEQYIGQKVLRITTYVKAKTAMAPAPAATSGKKAPISVDRGTSTSASSPPIQIQDVLESFVGVLSTAVNHLQEGLAAKSPKNPVPSISPVDGAAANLGEDESPAEETAAKKAEETQVSQEQEDSKVPAVGKKPAAEPASEEEEEDRPFIHGRHTCDSCLSTPIIGTRYHSTNVRCV